MLQARVLYAGLMSERQKKIYERVERQTQDRMLEREQQSRAAIASLRMHKLKQRESPGRS